jgi:hypothetical protein
MNEILQNKINELDSAKDYECWYLVKQDTSFISLCYQVEYLRQFQEDSQGLNLENFVKKSVAKLKIQKSDVTVSDTHRALRVAAFFGLITMTSTSYKDVLVTPTFYEIVERCDGEFEKTDLYTDIIQRQIEKMFISSNIDEEYDGVRKDFRLYPVMLLYKILVELGRSMGEYAISINEYRYLVATTKKFEDFLTTLLFIKLLRDEPSVNSTLEQYRTKFDNRLIQALKQLPTLSVESDRIFIPADKIEEVAQKVYIFEKNPEVFTTDNYLDFLASTKSLFDLDEDNKIDEALVQGDNKKRDYATVERLQVGTNTLLYGVPGAGKSYTIEHEYMKKENPRERLVFHPDYTYSDFVGQILPVVNEDSDGNKNVSYEFTPGPFTTILKDAYTNPMVEHFLVIEEINRGNAPAIFGEIFQLLDRKTEIDPTNDDSFPLRTSEYEISNSDVAEYVYGDKRHKIRIPSNLSIIGTMNTSDQNVFTLDTAFQRRWDMRLIENRFKDDDSKLAETKILDTSVTWEKFCTSINDIILDKNVRMTSSEDKRLGTHFIHITDLQPTEDDERHRRLFPEKVVKYLWDDAFKFTREEIFDIANYNSLEKVIRKFIDSEGDEKFNIFSATVKNILLGSQVSSESQE